MKRYYVDYPEPGVRAHVPIRDRKQTDRVVAWTTSKPTARHIAKLLEDNPQPED